MQAEIKDSQTLRRTLNEILTDGTLDHGNVEKAVKGTGNPLKNEEEGWIADA